jgi:hypothetical protein
VHTAPHLAGPHRPVLGTPPRRRPSIRRTATVDSRRPDGLSGHVVVDARARDLRTGADGEVTLERDCRLDLVVDATARRVVAASCPGRAWVEQLAGARTGQQFRRRLAEVAPAKLAATDPLLLLLLDDVPGSQLVAGFALHSDPDHSMAIEVDHLGAVVDVCAGWAADASILRQVRLRGEIPTPVGPPAPPLPDVDLDALAWHDVDPLGPHDMRRMRRLDTGPSTAEPGTWWFDAHFRDSHVDVDGLETAVHEYVVDGAVDPAARTITSISADARVLPWQECPQAVGSAQRVVGRWLGGLRATVLEELVGTSTCTHLNDVLRTLADLDHLIDATG